MTCTTRTRTAGDPRARGVLASALLLAVLAAAAPACGSRTGFQEADTAEVPDGTAEVPDASIDTAPRARTCLPNCTVGHRCCVGGCNGPAAITANDCCQCLPGETSSQSCPHDRCGS